MPHRKRKQAAIVVKKTVGRTTTSATPTQKSVKRTAPKRPTTRPTTKLKMNTVRVKRMKRPSGMPVSRMFMPRNV